MTKCCVFSMAMALASLVGCTPVGPTDGTGGGTADDVVDAGVKHANLTVNWSIQDTDGGAVSCGANYTSVVVHVMTYGKMLGDNEEEFTKLFDCSAGHATWSLPLSGDIPAQKENGFDAADINGHYDVWVSQDDPTGTVERQASLPSYFVDLTTGDKTVTNTLYENGGYYGVLWGFQGTMISGDFDCATSGVETVQLLATSQDTQLTTNVGTFPCANQEGHYAYSVGMTVGGADGEGTSSLLPAGEYKFVLKAFAGGVEVGSSDPDPFTQTVSGLTSLNLPYESYAIVLTTR